MYLFNIFHFSEYFEMWLNVCTAIEFETLAMDGKCARNGEEETDDGGDDGEDHRALAVISDGVEIFG